MSFQQAVSRGWVVPLYALFLALASGAVRPCGAQRVKVTYSVDVKQQAAQIAAEIAPKLGALHLAFRTQREALPGPPHPPEAVKNLLDETEATLLRSLSHPELAAMRDYVRARFQEARADQERMNRSHRTAPGGVVLAAYRAEESNGSDASGLDQVDRLLARLLEIFDKNDLIVNLCVTSKPKLGARFDMEPESFLEGGSETVTTGRLVNVYRGRYIYRAALKRAKPIECGTQKGRSCRPLDLVNDSRPLLVCDFDAGLCRRSDEAAPEGCRGND